MNNKVIQILTLSAFALMSLANSGVKARSCAEGCERNNQGNPQATIQCQRDNCRYEFNFQEAYEICKGKPPGGCDAYLRYSEEAFNACRRSCNDACIAVGRKVGGSPGQLTCRK